MYFHSNTKIALANFIKKYRNAFVRGVGDETWLSSLPVRLSLALPLWKSSKTQRTWKQMPTRLVRGSSPLKTRWLYGSFPAILPMLISLVAAEFIAVFSNEHKTVKTSRRGVFWTNCRVYREGFEKRAPEGT